MRVVLEIENGPLAGRRMWLPAAGSLRVGRTDRADLALPEDGHLSSLHFAVEADATGCRLRDLGSTNGTWVDGQRVTEAPLRDGSMIRAGTTTFRVRLDLPAQVEKPDPTPATRLRPPITAPRPVTSTAVAPDSAVAVQAMTADSARKDQPDETPAAIEKVLLPGQTPAGEYVLAVLVKRTYNIVPDQKCIRAAKDGKLIPGDVHYGDPMNSSVKLESDFVPFKIATDIVVNAKAYAPRGRPVTSLTPCIRVGSCSKSMLVLGDRVCEYQPRKAPAFSDPVAFTEMPLIYERAYGGVDVDSDAKVPCIYARNDLGRGFVIANTKPAVDGLPLPNLEDPDAPLTAEQLCVEHFWEWEKQPLPAGCGWYGKCWQPRAGYAGVMPADREAEQQLRAIYKTAVPPDQQELYSQTQLPDMDFRFFNGGSLGLVVPYLSGDEAVQLSQLDPEGELRFALPGERPRIGIDIGSSSGEPEVVLHTLQLRLDDEKKQIDMVWRAALPYEGPDSLPALKKLEIDIQ